MSSDPGSRVPTVSRVEVITSVERRRARPLAGLDSPVEREETLNGRLVTEHSSAEEIAKDARSVFLTRLGGGAFGNDEDWINDAMRLAFQRYAEFHGAFRRVSRRRQTSGEGARPWALRPRSRYA